MKKSTTTLIWGVALGVVLTYMYRSYAMRRMG